MIAKESTGMLVLGFKFPVSPSVSLFAEAGFVEGWADDDLQTRPNTESFWKGVGGVEIAFGKAKDHGW